jgi:hypothetical protein
MTFTASKVTKNVGRGLEYVPKGLEHAGNEAVFSNAPALSMANRVKEQKRAELDKVVGDLSKISDMTAPYLTALKGARAEVIAAGGLTAEIDELIRVFTAVKNLPKAFEKSQNDALREARCNLSTEFGSYLKALGLVSAPGGSQQQMLDSITKHAKNLLQHTDTFDRREDIRNLSETLTALGGKTKNRTSGSSLKTGVLSFAESLKVIEGLNQTDANVKKYSRSLANQFNTAMVDRIINSYATSQREYAEAAVLSAALEHLHAGNNIVTLPGFIKKIDIRDYAIALPTSAGAGERQNSKLSVVDPNWRDWVDNKRSYYNYYLKGKTGDIALETEIWNALQKIDANSKNKVKLEVYKLEQKGWIKAQHLPPADEVKELVALSNVKSFAAEKVYHKKALEEYLNTGYSCPAWLKTNANVKSALDRLDGVVAGMGIGATAEEKYRNKGFDALWDDLAKQVLEAFNRNFLLATPRPGYGPLPIP